MTARLLRLGWLLAVLACVAVPAQGAEIQVGLNLTHADIGGAEEACAAGAVQNIAPGFGIAANYRSGTIRGATIGAMCALASSRATAVRLMVWYGVARDAEAQADARRRLGVIDIDDAEALAGLKANLQAFLSDAAQAGMRMAIIAFGPHGRANPACGSPAGTCFDPSTAERSARTIAGIVRQLVEPQGLEVLVDLNNEICPGTNPGLAFNRNAENVAGTIVEQFRRDGPAARLGFSCTAASTWELQRRLDGIAAMYESASLAPGFVDVHLYRVHGEAEAMLVAADRFAERRGLRLMIGETSLGSPEAETALRLHREGRLPSLAAILFWPKRADSPCAVTHRPWEASAWAGAFATSALPRAPTPPAPPHGVCRSAP